MKRLGWLVLGVFVCVMIWGYARQLTEEFPPPVAVIIGAIIVLVVASVFRRDSN